ncbi:unnamed protein product [Parascedosporium putredinis]|uniref:3-hydroxyanthranilate 3,4-dioxygenase n=1 Tax=Parascedosporium putredinis TaxID=1442378 RepID=A0A9P1MAP6_9PEZI|nr:unnamed protein product [Parascedosporium putredinis]CAI7998046.1 unnamed protein product [Parascedosporium putredinis]
MWNRLCFGSSHSKATSDIATRQRDCMLNELEENSHLLQPPVNNYCVYNDHCTVMIVGGPNARTDYHINETPEWFYQYKGAMMLKVVDDGVFRDIIIREGDMFLLPQHAAQPRALRRHCCAIVHEASFHCTNLGTQIKQGVEDFKESTEARTCKQCGTLADWKPAPGSIKDPNLE